VAIGNECKDTVAFVLIKTELGMAEEVAQQVSTYNTKVEADDHIAVRGVRWTAIVTGPYDIVAAVRVDDNEALADLVVGKIQPTGGIKNPTTIVVGKLFVDGQGQSFGQNGFP
jgi:DNA-binding Lrp family transcriptional regulator